MPTHTHTHTHTHAYTHMPFPPPGNLPDPGIEPVSAALAGRFFTTEPLRKPPRKNRYGIVIADKQIFPSFLLLGTWMIILPHAF